ncbi:hypothetical protein GQR58_003956 [Nymphon striatum]|nr:hypothetical protein GQR58_003956 [Nymphon striatum]
MTLWSRWNSHCPNDRQTRERPATLLSAKLAELPAAARQLFHEDDATKKMIRRVRRGQFPPVPASLSELIIEDEWTQTSGHTPEPFFIDDNGQESNSRVDVFAPPPALRTLFTADIWFMDGNYAMAPPRFLQLYVIRVPLGSTNVGIVHALPQQKTQDTYEELLCALLDKCTSMELYPDSRTILVDFEQAVISAIGVTLGNDSSTQTEMVMDTIIKSSVSDASTQTDNMDIIIKNIEKEHNYATKYGQVHKVAQTVPIPPPQIDFSQEEDYEYKDDAYASTQTDNMDIIIKNIEKEHNYATKYGQVHKYKDDACDLDYESNSSFLSDSDWSDSEPEEFNEVGDDEYGGPAEEQTYLVFESSRELEIKILEHDNYTSELDLFGEDSVIPILHEIFDLAFPLSNRKLDFCRYKQAPGQTFTDCMTNLKQEGQTADLHSLDIDTLYVFRYVTGINDSNLRERFLKLENPNLNQFNMYILSK